MKDRHLSLSAQILVLCICLVMLVTLAISIIFVINLDNISKESLKKEAEISMHYLNADLLGNLSAYVNLVESGAAVINTLINTVPFEAMESVLEELSSPVPDAFDMYYGSAISRHAPEGIYIDSTGWEPDYEWDPPNRYWHQAAMANPGVTMIIDPYIDADTGSLVITVSRTASDANGRITGVIAVDVFLDKLSEIVLRERITEDSSTVLIDAEGLYIVHPDPSYMTEKNMFDEMPEIDKRVILNGQVNVLFEGNSYIASSPVHGTDWILVSMGSLKALQEETRRLLLFVVIVALIIAGFAALVALFLSHSLTKPFKQLAQNFGMISRGDLTASTPDYSSREASSLSKGFNNLADGISSMVRNIKDSSRNIKQVAEDLSISITETNETIAMVREGVDSIRTDVGRENKSIATSEAAVNRVMQEIEKLNDKIREQSSQISSSSSATEEMVANIQSIESTIVTVNTNVNELVKSSMEEKKRLSAASEAAKMVESESMALAEMNTVIANVATQTNLLSMNAAIEAAHAGEAGKGFAVVAQEIRKLAETTAQQSRNSEEALSSIQKQIREIASSSIHVEQSFGDMIRIIGGIEQLSENLKNAAEEQGEGSRQLLDSISALNTITSEVETGASSMQASAGDAVSACRELTDISRNVADTVNKCSQGVSSLSEDSKSVVFAAENTKVGVGALEKSVDHFKVR